MTKLTSRALQSKPRHELADMVVKLTEQLEALQHELTLERNTNVHLRASIRDRV